MKTRKTLYPFLLCIFVVSLLITSCGNSPTLFQPTATPQAARWEIEVVSTEVSREFDTWYITEGADNIFVIVSLEYTYNGQERSLFLPQSIILANTGTDGFSGWSRTPALYKPEGTSQIIDFSEDTLLNYLDPGGTRTDTFVWNWPNDSYTKFRLFFPEAEAIDISFD